jgi:hypothetical protein
MITEGRTKQDLPMYIHIYIYVTLSKVRPCTYHRFSSDIGLVRAALVYRVYPKMNNQENWAAIFDPCTKSRFRLVEEALFLATLEKVVTV